jgi:esterase
MKLAYREFGQGKALIILHGLFGQSDNWNTFARSFADKGFQVFTLDQRNHGLSQHSDVWDYEVMANDLKEFIDEHQLKDPILLGHSMGGKTVLFFEQMFPGLAKKLIIVDIATRAYKSHHMDVLKALHAVNFDSIQTRKEAENVMNSHIPDFGTKQFLLKNIYWKDNADQKMDWRFNLKVISLNYDNIRVAVPFQVSQTNTLIIKGGKSHYISEEDELDYKARFPKSELVSIAEADHWVHAEKPKEFSEAVLNFITD